MSEIKSLNPPLNDAFLRRLKGKDQEENPRMDFPRDVMKNILQREISSKDLVERLQKTKQDKISVKEIILDSEIDFINSIKQLKSVFEEELSEAIEKVNDLYNNELLKLQQIYRSEVIGGKLLELVKAVAPSGWYLLMKDSSVNLCRFYTPSYEVITGISEKKSMVYDYSEPVCYLKAIYVNILHDKVTYGTIHLASEMQHPNCDKDIFGQACAGNLEGREIPLDDTEELLQLLNEISLTYQRFHLDSSYYTPTTNFITRKDTTLWKTAI
ncbi:MAG: hypothetical protein LWX70_14945 [Sphingobacteriia bacterium]|nr:hypothetical protein [Sphingobacteriia bacterium]